MLNRLNNLGSKTALHSFYAPYKKPKIPFHTKDPNPMCWIPKIKSINDQSGNTHDNGAALQLLPCRPCNLLHQFCIRFLTIIDQLFHLYIAFRILAGEERFELSSTVLETAILPLNYSPK